ncbi:MAG: hypothetical protein COU08_02675 [Candidatus Harrisonbacteria bacterium CG10_big_fil_rev_8_21_14_0_10_42_17]|uniref:Proline--tRNA ligase n=1 Tax=Candidatus Harrisonbacteria bacterium CG10_big_fil_rev_8_21_14_0_10_42_17 TaxID=1974584 RepID=A0A2M6WHY4_9BACT|nr:MAG: hypothetical protein COU08_02675 [Candidatus Harrisonbacteria bacterium CG10_big_fil_rev_8_21_14_0_10_42_17]
MRQLELVSKVKKTFAKDEEALNARWLIRAGFVEKTMAGVYAFLPLGLRVLKKIETIVREEMNQAGGQELLLPVLHPKEHWEATGRWHSMDVLFKVKGRDGKEIALGPTHEESIVPIAKQHINSYQDLPVALYQIQTKFRDEPRAKSGLLRGREFIMKDLYSFHANQGDLEAYYERMKKVYMKLFKRTGLKAIEVRASGGSFANYSHEYQVLIENGEDSVFHCVCGFAENKEIVKSSSNMKCPDCGKKMQESKGTEVGNIFMLGTKYSDPFKLTFKDKNGKEQPVLMGCYGIGLGRIMGTIIEVHHDERGIVWPESVAPFQVHLIAIEDKHGQVVKRAEKFYTNLHKAGIETLIDDRKISGGAKLAEADILGIPYRVVISGKTGSKIEVKKRNKKTSLLETPQAFLARLNK